MQRDFTISNTIRSILPALLFVSMAVLSCNSSNGPVGVGVIPPATIHYDTLYVNGFSPLSIDGYTGKLTYFPIGKYNDPLFGDFEAVGYIKPSISPLFLDTVLDNDYIMYLDLVMDSENYYGDTGADTDIALYDVTESWRGNAFRLSTKPAYDTTTPIATFSMQGRDSIRIELPGEWRDRYVDMYRDTTAARDSLYNYGFSGLAVVPVGGSSKISFPTTPRSRFVLLNPDRQDTAIVAISDWAYSLEHTNAPAIPDRLTLTNTLSSLYNIDLNDELDTLTKENLLKAELILYEDSEQMDNSLPANHERVNPVGVALKNGYTTDLDFDLFFKEPDASGVFDEKIKAYRFNITAYVNTYIFDSPKSNDVYLEMRPAGGLLSSTILFDSSAPDSLKPKLILLTTK